MPALLSFFNPAFAFLQHYYIINMFLVELLMKLFTDTLGFNQRPTVFLKGAMLLCVSASSPQTQIAGRWNQFSSFHYDPRQSNFSIVLQIRLG